MKHTRWMMLLVLAALVLAGGAWAGLNWPLGQTPTETAQTPPEAPSSPAAPPESPESAPGFDEAGDPSDAPAEPAPPANAPEGAPAGSQRVSFGDADYEVDAPERQIHTVDASGSGKRLDYWLASKFPQFPISLIDTWLDERRVAVNRQLVRGTYELDEGDEVLITITEYTALRLIMEDYLSKPGRVEFDLFEITIYPPQELPPVLVRKRFLAVGPLFRGDIRNVKLEVLPDLAGRLDPWDEAAYVGAFKPYQLFELK